MKLYKILIVDDDESMLNLLGILLQHNGYEVVSTSNPVDGIEHAIANHPDLIILDNMMPVLCGKEFIRHLKKRNVPAKVLMLTSSDDKESIIDFTKEGVCDYITKPFDLNELSNKIKKALLLEEANILDKSNKPEISDLHPAILEKCQDSYLSGRFDDAIFNAFKLVEERVRLVSGLSFDDIGVSLISKAMNPSNPILCFSDVGSEREAMHSLYRGAIGVFKNPHSHRFVNEKSVQRSFEILTFASLLLNMIDNLSCLDKTSH